MKYIITLLLLASTCFAQFKSDSIAVGTGTFTGPVYSSSTTKTNPGANEFVTSTWVNSILNNGQFLYGTTNIMFSGLTNFVNGGSNNATLIFGVNSPVQAIKQFTNFSIGEYFVTIVSTNLYRSISGPFVNDLYATFAGNANSARLSIHPDIFVTYDFTNLVPASNTPLSTAAPETIVLNPVLTNLYTWTQSSPQYNATNSTGFYIVRRMKVDDFSAGSGGDVPTLTVHSGGITPTILSFLTPVAVSANYAGSFTGDAAGLTNLQASSLTGYAPTGVVATIPAAADGWLLSSSNGVRNWSRNGGMLTNLQVAAGVSLSGTNVWTGTNTFSKVLIVQTNISIGMASNYIQTANLWLNDGTTPSSGLFGATDKLISSASGASTISITTAGYATTDRGIYRGYRSRGTLNNPSAVQLDDMILSIGASGYDGTSSQLSGLVDFFCDGTVSSGIVPTRISFTTGNSASTRQERLQIKASGIINVQSNLNVGGAITATNGISIGHVSDEAFNIVKDQAGWLNIQEGSIGYWKSFLKVGFGSWGFGNSVTFFPSVTYRVDISGNARVSDSLVCSNLVATSGIILQRVATNNTIVCTTNKQIYMLGGTNQIVTLVNAANVVGTIHTFSSTNQSGSFILTNATGGQTIGNGQFLSYTNFGAGSVAFISDGAHWYYANGHGLIGTDDINFPITTLNPAGSETSGTLVSTSGQSGTQMALRMAALSTFFVVPQMKHDWIEGTTVYPHIHIEPQTANANSIAWRISYAVANIDGTFPADTVLTNTIDIPTSQQWRHLVFNLPTNGIAMGTNTTSANIRLKYSVLTETEPLDVVNYDVHYLYQTK